MKTALHARVSMLGNLEKTGTGAQLRPGVKRDCILVDIEFYTGLSVTRETRTSNLHEAIA